LLASGSPDSSSPSAWPKRSSSPSSCCCSSLLFFGYILAYSVDTSLLFLVARLNVYASDSGSRVAFCDVGSKSKTYDFLVAARLPVKVNMSLLPEPLLSSTRRLYLLGEADVRVVVRDSEVCAGLWLSGGYQSSEDRRDERKMHTFDAAVASSRGIAVRYAVANVQAEVCFFVRLDTTLRHGGRHRDCRVRYGK
jgi:hypothetical protein